MSHAEHQTIKARIVAELKRRGYSQREFAAKCRVTQSWLNRWMNGHRQAREDALDRMLRALGL